MADVARLADVSVPTVSRVLSGATKVSPKRQERVLRAVETLGFHPSAAARVLASSRPDTVAVVAGSTAQYGYAETLRGIEEASRRHNVNVIISVIDSVIAEEVERVAGQVLMQPILGAVVLKFDPPGVAVLDHLVGRTPVVAVSGRRDKRVPQALFDETRAAEELTRHLLDLGHRTVHHVRIPPSRKEDGRTTGWRRALRAAGAEIPAVFDATWEPVSGRDIGHVLPSDVTAVFCGNDEIAMGVIRGLADRGRRVPADVSVVGFDDHPLAQLWSPALTTARQDFAGLGARAFAALISHAAHPEEQRRVSSERPTLVMRESTAPPQPQILP